MYRVRLFLITNAAAIVLLCAAFVFGKLCTDYQMVVAYKVAINSTEKPKISCDVPKCVNIQEVYCDNRLSGECAEPDQWVAGVRNLPYDASNSIELLCCTYSPMSFSSIVGVTKLAPGQFYEGGYRFSDAEKTRLIGYDLIKNIKQLDHKRGYREFFRHLAHRARRSKRENKASYSLEVARINCIPPPPEYVNTVDFIVESVPDLVGEMLNVYSYKILDGGELIPDGSSFLEGYPVRAQELPPPQWLPSPQGLPSAQGVCCPGTCCEPPPPPPCCPRTCCSAKACFAEGTLLTTPGGKVEVQNLQVGDFVLSYDLDRIFYAPVTSFWHYDPEMEIEFLRIKTELEEDLVLSDLHFVYAISCNEEVFRTELKTIHKKLIYAKDLRKDEHCLVSIFDEKSAPKIRKILSITKEQRCGVYAPMTSNGRLVAQEILASCYSVVEDPYLLSHAFPWSRMVDKVVQWLKDRWVEVESEKFLDNYHGLTQNERRTYLPSLIDFGLGVIDKMIIYSKLF